MNILKLWLKRIWFRAVMADPSYKDAFRNMEQLYRINDPWNLASEPERFRFQTTNELILREFGRVGRLLEVGCGEGAQTEYLLHCCSEISGIDVSGHAVSRLEARGLQGRFEKSNLFDYRPA